MNKQQKGPRRHHWCIAIGMLLSVGLALYHNLGLRSVPNFRWQYTRFMSIEKEKTIR